MPGTLSRIYLVFAGALVLQTPTVAAEPTAPTTAAATERANAVAALKEIGHTAARTAFCQTVLDHAARATTVALENDSALAAVSDALAHTDLDENAMAKPKMTYELQRRYEALMARTKEAVNEFKALATIANQAPTLEQKTALAAYSDALGGALHRQELVAGEFIRFGAFLEAHAPVSWQQHDRDMVRAAITQPRPEEMATDPRDRVPARLTDLAKAEATHLDERHESVFADEIRAAAHVDRAFRQCGGSE